MTSEPFVVRLVDDAHPAGVHDLDDHVLADPSSFPSGDARPDPSRGGCDRRRETIEGAGLFMGGEQRLDLPAQLRIVAALFVEQPCAGVAVALDAPAANTSCTRCRRSDVVVKSRSVDRRSSLQLPIQPRPGDGPVAFDGCGRDVQRIGRLLDAHAAIKAAFDDPRLTLVDCLQPLEGFVELDQLVAPLVRNGQRIPLVEGHDHLPAAAFAAAARPRSR